VELEIFTKHIAFLSEHFNILDLENLKNHVEKGIPLEKKSLFITFDDGWASNYKLLPFLEEKKIPITIFLTTKLIGTNKTPSPISEYMDTNIDNKYPTQPNRTMLNYEEIREMREIVNFQSHGINHHPLNRISSELLRLELLESKKQIEEITGRTVYAFAYPYNIASEKEAKIVESCGYLMARRGERMLNKIGDNYFLINSIGIESDCSVEELRNKLLRAELKTILNS
jgi:peptidoglycan/xylan/chitin deacetylase (PgdA/CDA1 family)